MFNILPSVRDFPSFRRSLFALIHQRGSRRAPFRGDLYLHPRVIRVHERKSRYRRAHETRGDHVSLDFNHRGNVLQPNRDGPSDGSVVVPVAATPRDGRDCDRPNRYPVRAIVAVAERTSVGSRCRRGASASTVSCRHEDTRAASRNRSHPHTTT